MPALFFSLKRFPFETNNPLGYLIVVILEYIICGYEFFIVACTLALGIGAFWLAISVTKEIQRILCLIDEKIHANENQSTDLNILFSGFVETIRWL